MSASTVSGTIQDPSGQIFANGTWQLVFKPTPNTPGLFTDAGVPFTTLFGGSLDNTGSFSQAGVARTDTIAPAGSKWSLIVSPNANGQAYSVDLNVNSGAFNASAAINAAITNIVVQAIPIAHAYKDSEVIPVPGSGGIYFDVTLKILKIWDIVNQVWIPASVVNPATIPTGTGFFHATAGVEDAASKLVNLTAASDVAVNQGTTTTLLHGNSAGLPSFSQVNLVNDVTGALPIGNQAAPTGTGFDHITGGSRDGSAKLVSLTAATDVAANQGTNVTVLHGNAAGQASFAVVTPADAAGNTSGSGNFALATGPTLSAPIINGTPTGTGIPTHTLKKGTGAGNYTSTSLTPVVVDGTNLSFTVTIPVGWKLSIWAAGTIASNTVATTVAVSIADGGTRLQEVTALGPVAAGGEPFNLVWVITGDGASHTIDLRYFTTNASDAVFILNGSSIQIPTMLFDLSPSN